MGFATNYENYRAEVQKIVESVIKPRSEQTDREGYFQGRICKLWPWRGGMAYSSPKNGEDWA
jgi:hypothetical protein